MRDDGAAKRSDAPCETGTRIFDRSSYALVGIDDHDRIGPPPYRRPTDDVQRLDEHLGVHKRP
ncbi:MAG: hypothetical protein ACLQLO_20985 [Mycobacterium sp.]